MPDNQLKELREYITPSGNSPFEEWLSALKDSKTRARIRVRLDRLSLGLFGDRKSLGNGLHELRLDFGSGYRVYFGQDGDVLIILLCGGDKSTQRKDIENARLYWKDYLRRIS